MGFWIFLFCSKRTQLFRKLLCHALCSSYVFNIDKVHCIASCINKKEMLKKTYFCSLCFSRGKSLTPTGQSAMLHIEKKKNPPSFSLMYCLTKTTNRHILDSNIQPNNYIRYFIVRSLMNVYKLSNDISKYARFVFIW